MILIVEDEPALALALRQGLEEQNHTVAVASDGAEALDILEQHLVDAIVLDAVRISANSPTRIAT